MSKCCKLTNISSGNRVCLLIVTVDNRVAGHEAIDLAQRLRSDVIVTPPPMPEVLPDAYAIVHPEHPEADILKHLAGELLKLACAPLEEVLSCLIAAVGTIADMVSLTDEKSYQEVQQWSRSFTQYQRIGFQELFEIAGIASDITGETVGFQLGYTFECPRTLG